MHATENFPITGYRLDPALIRALAVIKKAAALANAELGLLDKGIADAIVRAADEIIDGKLHDQFIVDPINGGAGTSVNMNANEVIANRALELLGKEKGDYRTVSPNSHVNMSQSTNDCFPTAVNIAALMALDPLLKAMEELSKSFWEKAEEFQGILKMGRTHLQDAVPIQLGQEFEAYARVLDRDIHRIRSVRERLYAVNMGATAVGTGLNALPEYIENVVGKLADFTGYPIRTVDSLVDGTQNTDVYAELSSALKICMLNMSKVANDLRLMASGPRAGLNEIQLPARQPGSSIMPGKINPVIPEVLNQCAFFVAGNDLTVSMACEAGQLEINVMKPVIAFKLLESIRMMTHVFRVFRTHCVDGIVANKKQMEKYVSESVGIITALNPIIGYEKASEIAKEAIRTGRPVRNLIVEKGVLTEEELNRVLNPEDMTRPGILGKELLNRKAGKKEKKALV
jgi:Fumarase C C-terminus./Lyase.